jgi:2-polyprenyl-3-methyl-5-hydroxy-6-metoxy-1,4-benzoquinol methylase
VTESPPPCELCDSGRLVLQYALRNPIFRCVDCGVLVSKQAWDGTDTAAWYSAEFFAHNYWQEHSADASPDLPVYHRTLDRLAQMGLPGGRLLDVGCGLGVFMQAAQKRGFDVQGTEVSRHAANQVRQQLQIPVFLGELETAAYPPQSFDAVTLWDVLEHVQRPSALLRQVGAILRKDGWLVVRAPNEDTLINQIARSAYALSAGQIKGPLQRMHEYYHLYYFTRQTLARLLERHGFRIVDRWGGEVHLSRVATSALVRSGLRALYGLQALLGMQYEQVVIARKIGAEKTLEER